MCKLTTPKSVAWSQKAKCTNNLPRRARPTRVSPAARRQTASDKQGHHGAKWQRHKLMKKRLGMGRSEDAPIVSEWGATKRRSEALQDDDTCETMIVAELQRLVFSLSIFSRHAAPHPLHSRISGYREALADDGRVPVSSSSSSTIAAETWRTKGSNKSTKILHRIGRLAAAGPVRSAETPRWPLFRASHFPLLPILPACQISASASAIVVFGSERWCSWGRVRGSRLIVCIHVHVHVHVQGHGLSGPCLLTEAWACQWPCRIAAVLWSPCGRGSKGGGGERAILNI